MKKVMGMLLSATMGFFIWHKSPNAIGLILGWIQFFIPYTIFLISEADKAMWRRTRIHFIDEAGVIALLFLTPVIFTVFSATLLNLSCLKGLGFLFVEFFIIIGSVALMVW